MCVYVILVAPSVTQAMATLITPNDNRAEHSINVTCTVRPDSNADMCVVMAMAVGRTREGREIRNEWTHYTFMHMYVHTYMYILDILHYRIILGTYICTHM